MPAYSTALADGVSIFASTLTIASRTLKSVSCGICLAISAQNVSCSCGLAFCIFIARACISSIRCTGAGPYFLSAAVSSSPNGHAPPNRLAQPDKTSMAATSPSASAVRQRPVELRLMQFPSVKLKPMPIRKDTGPGQTPGRKAGRTILKSANWAKTFRQRHFWLDWRWSSLSETRITLFPATAPRALNLL